MYQLFAPFAGDGGGINYERAVELSPEQVKDEIEKSRVTASVQHLREIGTILFTSVTEDGSSIKSLKEQLRPYVTEEYLASKSFLEDAASYDCYGDGCKEITFPFMPEPDVRLEVKKIEQGMMSVSTIQRASVEGAPPTLPYHLELTFKQEEGGWKIHGMDKIPAE